MFTKRTQSEGRLTLVEQMEIARLQEEQKTLRKARLAKLREQAQVERPQDRQ